MENINGTPILTLVSHGDRDKGVDQYDLYLSDSKKGHLAHWVCTSSHRLGQQKGDQHTRGGLLPTMLDVNFKNYTVSLSPRDSSSVPGVDGWFYNIYPWEFRTTKNTLRGHFGIHLDINRNGTMGCIGMSREVFSDFMAKMKWVATTYKLDNIMLLHYAS